MSDQREQYYIIFCTIFFHIKIDNNKKINSMPQLFFFRTLLLFFYIGKGIQYVKCHERDSICMAAIATYLQIKPVTASGAAPLM